MATNPFSYTSRDFNSIYEEIDDLYPNKPDWFKTTIAGLFSVAHWYLDARAQNLLLTSAFTPQSILNIAAFLDYYPSGISPSSGQLVVKLDDSVTLPYTLLKVNQLFNVSNINTGDVVNLIGVEDVTFTSGRYKKIKVVQGSQVPRYQVGITTNSSWQEIVFADVNIQYNTIRVFVATSLSPLLFSEWEVKTTLVNSFPTDQHVRIIKKPDGLLTIQFGNGEYGAIPADGLPVYISYTTDGGITGNFLAGNTRVVNSNIGVSTGTPNQSFDIVDKVVLNDLVIKVNGVQWFRVADMAEYGGTDRVYTADLVESTGNYRVTFGNSVNGQTPPNTHVITATYKKSDNVVVSYTGTLSGVLGLQYPYEDFTGGAAEESIETTRFMAPLSLKSLEKAVTEDDFEYLSKKYSTSIAAVKCLPMYYGQGTVGIHIIPAGGGNPSTTLKSQLSSYLNQRTPLSVVDVRVRNPVYVPRSTDVNPIYRSMSIDATLYIKQGYSLVSYFAYGSLVLRMLVTEVATELYGIYESQGIQNAVNFINAKWNFNNYVFTDSDYTEVDSILGGGCRKVGSTVETWGGKLRPNDIVTGLSDLTGADYAEVATPTSIIMLPFDRVFSDKEMVFNLSVQVS